MECPLYLSLDVYKPWQFFFQIFDYNIYQNTHHIEYILPNTSFGLLHCFLKNLLSHISQWFLQCVILALFTSSLYHLLSISSSKSSGLAEVESRSYSLPTFRQSVNLPLVGLNVIQNVLPDFAICVTCWISFSGIAFRSFFSFAMLLPCSC